MARVAFFQVVKVITPLTLKTFIVGHSMKSPIAHPGKRYRAEASDFDDGRPRKHESERHKL